MKKKSIAFVLCCSSLLALAGCNDDNTTTPTTPTTPSSLFSNANDIKSAIENTKFNGYYFSDKANKITDANVKFYKNETVIQGTADFEEEGKTKFIRYRGYTNTKFYDIDSYSGSHAREKTIVETKSSDTSVSKFEITKKEIESEMSSLTYDKGWFIDDLLSFFGEENNPTFKESFNAISHAYNVSLSAYGGGYKTMKAELSFNELKELLTGSVSITDWGKDNFDSETKTPLDEDFEPVSSSEKEVTLLLGEITGSNDKISFDVSPYFITSIDSFSIKGYSYGLNDGEAYINDSIKFEVNKYSPETALNSSDIVILSSGEESVIKCENKTLNTYKAIASGSSKITIGIPNTDVKASEDVIVLIPQVKYLWISTTKTTVETGKQFDVKMDFTPDGCLPNVSKGDISVVIADETKIRFDGLSNDLSTAKFTALADTNGSKVAVNIKYGSSITSNTLNIIVKDPIVEADKTWLVGTWKAKVTQEDGYGDDITFTTTFVFNADNTGNVEQKVTMVAVPNSASFTYAYDGTNIVILSWEEDDDNTIRKPTSIVVSSDKTSVTIQAKCMDSEGDYLNVTMDLKKEVDISWLVGTWNANEDDDYSYATLTFNDDFTGSIKFTTYGGASSFTYTYDGSKLSLKLSSTIYSFVSDNSKSKDKLVLKFDEEDEGNFTLNLTKSK